MLKMNSKQVNVNNWQPAVCSSMIKGIKDERIQPGIYFYNPFMRKENILTLST